MAGSRRISSLAVPVVASLDPSSKDNMKQWVNLMGRSAEEIQAILGAYSAKTAKSLKDPLDNFALHVDKVINKAAASAARTGFVPDASIQQLRVAVELSNLLGDSFLKWKASETLNLAESLRLPEALTLAKQLNSELAHVREAAASGLAGQARMQNDANSYDSAVFDWADRQEAQRRAGAAGRRLDNQENAGPVGLSPAAEAMQREEAKRRAADAGRRIDDSDRHVMPVMSPAAMANMEREWHERIGSKYDSMMSPPNGPTPPRGPVPLSPAAEAALRDEFNASRVRGQHEYDGNGRLGMLPGTVPLSPAVEALRQEERDQKWRNARADTGNIPGEEQRSRIFAAARDQEAEAERRRITEARAQSFANRMADRQNRRIPGIIANEGERDSVVMEDDGDIDEAATSGRVLHHRSIDGRRRQGVRGRGIFGGLTKGGSHSIRFAAQNVGFGVDDAIQSYQYGGAGASIRAASNNATAIAGMLITNPVIAAGAVIAISIASAALPIILRRFGLDKPFDNLTATERFNSQMKENMFGGYSVNENYARDKTTSEQTWIANQKARLIGRDFDSDQQWLQGSLQKGGFSGFINNMVGKQVAGGQKMTQNAAERKLLEAENMDLQTRSNSGWDATATKELERNLARMEELDKEDRVLRAERGADAQTISRARRALPANLKRIAEMSAYDRETDMALNRGDLDLAGHDRRLDERAELERKAIRANSQFNTEQQRAELLRVDMKLMEDKANPDRGRLIQLAQHDALQNRTQFDQSLNPQNNYTQGRMAYEAQFRSLYRQSVDGSLSPEEAGRRQRALTLRQGVLGQRALEDDVDSLNPERNPLRRLQRSMQRQTDDIKGLDIDPERRRLLLLAQLKGRERDAAEAMIPSGTRKYITQGYKVGSLEDEELRARMVGNFGPPVKKEDHDSKTLDEILTALNALNEKLTIEAAKLGV